MFSMGGKRKIAAGGISRKYRRKKSHVLAHAVPRYTVRPWQAARPHTRGHSYEVLLRSGQRRVVFQKKPAPSPDLVHENETPMKLIALRYYRMGILCLQRFCGEMGGLKK
jgi:hypothetical protein